MTGLDLGAIGNCSYGALINRRGTIVWCCLPRFDGDPVFHSLLGAPKGAEGEGRFAIELDELSSTEQFYEPNTAVLKTRLHGPSGSVEITDFAPRFESRGRMFRPLTLVRRVRPISGSPLVTASLKPRFGYGAVTPVLTRGSNHIRYVGEEFALRVTTNSSLSYLRDERPFILNRPVDFILGEDETLTTGVAETARLFEDQTIDYWRRWSRRLAVPLEWQDAVIRAAITLKLCVHEDTGAIVAALTTSIPEAPGSERNWDYRFCWLRDAFFVIRALNSLSEVGTMEDYLQWLRNVVRGSAQGHLQPVYGISLERELNEQILPHLPGFQGMGPVRIGNQAYEHFQHDVYGSIVLGSSQAYFDHRLLRRADTDDFFALEQVGEQAYRLHAEPDAGMWELRSRARVHTSSSLMCWAACDRLAKIASYLGRPGRSRVWRVKAEEIRDRILTESWNPKRGAFVESFGGKDLDASVLLMAEVGLVAPDDPRFVSTVEKLQETLGAGPFMRRYEGADDYGRPEVAFNVCTFWLIDALSRMGRRERAREMFEAMLEKRNPLGLLSEDLDCRDGRLWGNFPQTYSMVGIINGAVRLSKGWETVI